MSEYKYIDTHREREIYVYIYIYMRIRNFWMLRQKHVRGNVSGINRRKIITFSLANEMLDLITIES